MTNTEAVIADTHRREWARVLAVTLRSARDIDLAEECVQEAYAAALESWGRDGIPRNPAAWLTTIARRRAIDAMRRDARLRSRLPLLVDPVEPADEVAMPDPDSEYLDPADAIPDERLRLIFTCCHPALAQEAQVALTLRLVCGVTTARHRPRLPGLRADRGRPDHPGQAQDLLGPDPYRIPRPAELPARLRAVLGRDPPAVHRRPHRAVGPALVQAGLVDQALHLARMLRELLPDDAEVRGLLALLLVTDARRATRADDSGRLLRLAGPGPVAVGPGRAGRGPPADRGQPDRRAARPVRAPGRHCLALRRGPVL